MGEAGKAGVMELFELVRDEDESGVSGTGRVAQGVVFDDGHVSMRWLTPARSTTFYQSLSDVVTIHGHQGKTRVTFTSQPPAVRIVKPELGRGADAEDVMIHGGSIAEEMPGARAAYDAIDSILAPDGWTAWAGWAQEGSVVLYVRSNPRLVGYAEMPGSVWDEYEQHEVLVGVSPDGIRHFNRRPGVETYRVLVDGREFRAGVHKYMTSMRSK